MSLPIFLFTDFGSADLYVGQVKAVLLTQAPQSTVIDLLNDAPAFDVTASAHLLAALIGHLPKQCAILAVVDPGVGSTRGTVALRADERWLVGPDNGLLSVVAARAQTSACFTLDWVPLPQYASFHGRDLFAPALANIASGRIAVDRPMRPQESGLDVRFASQDFARVIYIDHYGNAMTGVRARSLDDATILRLRQHEISHARVFSAVPQGALFWYENSIGLVELAANQASAAVLLGARIGDEVTVAEPERGAG